MEIASLRRNVIHAWNCSAAWNDVIIVIIAGTTPSIPCANFRPFFAAGELCKRGPHALEGREPHDPLRRHPSLPTGPEGPAVHGGLLQLCGAAEVRRPPLRPHPAALLRLLDGRRQEPRGAAPPQDREALQQHVPGRLVPPLHSRGGPGHQAVPRGYERCGDLLYGSSRPGNARVPGRQPGQDALGRVAPCAGHL